MQRIAIEVMKMREEQTNKPSQKNKDPKNLKKPWFWPLVYTGFSVVFVGMIWGYNVYVSDDTAGDSKWTDASNPEKVAIETNASAENMKYPFKEALLDSVEVVQHYYDMEADAATRENALLVFNETTYMTSTGVSLSMKGEPFEIIAAMSGKVEEVNIDPFEGDEIVLSHANGMQTKYRSVTGILVKVGDAVEQGQPLATAAENEWNPSAGVHLQFEVYEEGILTNPESLLAF